MTKRSSKIFNVIFMARSCYKTTLQADSEADAIAKARKLWDSRGDEAFIYYDGDTGAWDAEEVQP